MKKACLSIVTEKQKNFEEAEDLALDLIEVLPKGWELITIESYHKFENSFRIELECMIQDTTKESLSHYAISLTDRLFGPWMVYFDSDLEQLEMIFNRSSHSQFAQSEFTQILWAHWQFVD